MSEASPDASADTSADAAEHAAHAANAAHASESDAAPCQSPPPVPRPANFVDDPRAQLLSMAQTLTRSRSHRLLMDYLRLRRELA